MSPPPSRGLNQLRTLALLAHFQLKRTPENLALMRAISWLPRRPAVRVQGIYAIVDTSDWWMRIGFSKDIWRRCYVDHNRALRRDSHPCLALQNDCTGIDGRRWRVLVLEEVRQSWRLGDRERWWRAHVQNEFERDEHWTRYQYGFRDRRPEC
jgi:hypothetical protein